MKANIVTIDRCLLPLSVFTLISLTAIASLGADKPRSLCQQQNLLTEATIQTKNVEQSQAIVIWCEADSWTIESDRKLNSELTIEDAIDWDTIEVNYDSDLELNLE